MVFPEGQSQSGIYPTIRNMRSRRGRITQLPPRERMSERRGRSERINSTTSLRLFLMTKLRVTNLILWHPLRFGAPLSFRLAP